MKITVRKTGLKDGSVKWWEVRAHRFTEVHFTGALAIDRVRYLVNEAAARAEGYKHG